ncbi:MAG: flagellar basal body rod protein FlgB [Planctomycetaceae bacterium]
MSVTPSQFDLLWKLLDASELKQRVIGQNIANVNTPNYRRLDVTFEEELDRYLANPEESKTRELNAKVFEAPGLMERLDGNNVDVDQEVGQLQKNALLYETYAQILASKLGMMRSAIAGR